MAPRPWTLTAKLVATGTTFLVLAVLSIGLTLWASWKLDGGAAAVNEAGRLRMLAYRMALALPAAGEPSPGALVLARNFDELLALLERGDPARPLAVPWSGEAGPRFAAVQADWTRLRSVWLDGAGDRQPLQEADAFVEHVDAFVAAVEQNLAGWTSLLRGLQLGMLGLAVASAAALLYTGYLLVLHPVAQLRRGFSALRQGDLAARVQVASTDEFGQLSAGFNDMARDLQSLYGSLEERVREKAALLEVKRRRLADLVEVGAFLARATQLEGMAQGFARHMRRIGAADGAAVRWSDQHNRRYVLLASDNVPEALLRNEHCLEAGACLCGQPAGAAGTRTIPIRTTDAPLLHCANLGYAAIVSVPIRLHDQVLGELDLFYRAPVALEPGDRELLDTLASNMAGAMESLRAAALEREAAVAQERSLIARELHDSIAQSLAFLRIQVQLLRDAVRKGDAGATAAAIGELDQGVRESYADVRELLVHFRTRTSEEDIAPALATTLNKFTHQTGLPAELEMRGHGVALAPDVQVQVLHIVQEALSNVRKHARASRVVLTVDTAPHWRFEVRDDGAGFDAARHEAGETHVGLRIMQERAQRIGAVVRVASAPGAGCSVVLELPAQAGAREEDRAPAVPEPALA
jgi:two-component system nitrate/nitrite sensor histidine kinase NarX